MGRPKEAKPVECLECKNIFTPVGTRVRKFCSFQCRDANKRAKRVNEIGGTARCAKCKSWKPIDEFAKGAGGKPHSYCKVCHSAWFEARRRRLGQKPFVPADPIAAEKRQKIYKREWNRIAQHNRRAAGKMPNSFEIGRMLCQQDAKCAYCGELLSGQYHIDHKLPVSRGGSNDIENLHITCARCNLRKATLTHEEFLVSKRRRPFRQVGPVGKLP